MEGKEGSYDTKEYVHRSTSTLENRTNELWNTIPNHSQTKQYQQHTHGALHLR